jgi:hypothetical protein
MRHRSCFLGALAGLLVISGNGVAPAADTSLTKPQPAQTTVKTGKERLGDKASDEQRVDDCKVPPQRRGRRIRPDACQSDN